MCVSVFKLIIINYASNKGREKKRGEGLFCDCHWEKEREREERIERKSIKKRMRQSNQ